MAVVWKTAWVTGASSGIGRELALRLARSGVRVAASARTEEKLLELAASDSRIVPVPVDVTERRAMAAACERITSELGPIDLAILNAGVWHVMDVDNFDAEKISDTFDVNCKGIVNALQPLLPDMMARRSGHLALVASVAGYRGLPKAMAYGPSKAATIMLAEILRLELEPRGVTVSVVNPGFVDTPMTAKNTFPMPFMLNVEDAAERVLRGLEQGKFEIAFPWQTVVVLKFLRHLPHWAYARIVRRKTM